MIHGILIDNGTLKVVDIHDELGTYYDMLKCSTIDIVERKIGGQWYSIVCDEEGLYNDDAPVSMMSERYQQPMLVGNLFICKDGGQGELASLTDDEVEFIKGRFKHCVIWGDY